MVAIPYSEGLLLHAGVGTSIMDTLLKKVSIPCSKGLLLHVIQL